MTLDRIPKNKILKLVYFSAHCFNQRNKKVRHWDNPCLEMAAPRLHPSTVFLSLIVVVIKLFGIGKACFSDPACPLSGHYCGILFVRVVPTTSLQLQVLQSLSTSQCHFHLITPRVPTLFKRNAFILTPSALHTLSRVTPVQNLEVRSTDLSAEFASLPQQIDSTESIDNISLDSRYYALPLIYAGWHALANLHGAHVSLIQYGKSWNGNPLIAIRVSFNNSCTNCDRQRKVLLVSALLHAREWATVTVAHRVIFDLLTQEGMRLLEQNDIDVVVVPIANPDGYKYSRNGDRLWRRNRPPFSTFKCAAVDLYLNFPPVAPTASGANLISWSLDPCSSEYGGPYPLSEPETRGLFHLVTDIIGIDRLAAHIDVHSYGSVVRGPWHIADTANPHTVNMLDEIGEKLAQIMRSVHGMTYTYRRHSSFYSGYLADWLFSHGTFSYVVSIRPVRDTDFERAFALPEGEIRAAADEVAAAVRTIMKLLK